MDSRRPSPQPHPLPPFDPWLWWQASAQTWMATLDPRGTGRRLRQWRLDRLLDCALRDSPLYAQRAQGARVLADFEPIGKPELMQHFDAWATDRRITRQGAEAAIASGADWSNAWLGRYLVWTSSGTTGEPGIFVQDTASLAAFDAIDALRLRGCDPAQLGLGGWGLGRRYAYVGAIGGPYAGHISMRRLQRVVPAPWTPQVELISVLQPLTEIARQLEQLQPDVLITYPSCAAALAPWQAQADPGLRLTELWLGGEQLTAAQRLLLHSSYRCTLRNSYGASEFYSMAFECAQGRLHLNDDWVMLEGIDARGQPVPDGEFSHSTLLTNLANHVQPLLRYQLMDRVCFVPEPCPCGCAFPVIAVQGRSDDVLMLPALHGAPVALLPLALETVIEEGAGVTLFQLLLRADGVLELRLPGAEADTDRDAVSDAQPAFVRCRRALRAYLTAQGVQRQRIVRGRHEPQRQPGSGKLRRVIDLSAQG